ncbi:hypothetical protein DFJ73DRAFT_253186 [Zopfochytrium polystomum]|nr:hypothetical protein DFJ73DRAFT_253186 [Zopfochytrium polystomum]
MLIEGVRFDASGAVSKVQERVKKHEFCAAHSLQPRDLIKVGGGVSRCKASAHSDDVNVHRSTHRSTRRYQSSSSANRLSCSTSLYPRFDYVLQRHRLCRPFRAKGRGGRDDECCSRGRGRRRERGRLAPPGSTRRHPLDVHPRDAGAPRRQGRRAAFRAARPRIHPHPRPHHPPRRPTLHPVRRS